MLINLDQSITGFIDLTGRFPKISSHGNQYIMVRYHYDVNCILAKLIKNRQGSTITEAWQSNHNDFKKAGTAPTTYILDNETSKELMEGFDKERISYQLVTPYKHRNN